MPRPQRDLDPGQGPVQAFAGELRALRAEAGDPKFVSMSRRSGRSKTALSEAVGGRHLPRWETVVGFVEACGGRPEDWRARWEDARAAAATTDDPAGPPTPGPTAPQPPTPDPPVDAPGRPDPHRRARAVAALTGAALLGAAVALGTVALVSTPGGGAPVPVVVVQNKVAVGPDALLEDATPAYLSSRAAPYCKPRGCAVPGTDMTSGAVLAVDCVVASEDMINYEADSVLSRDNPHRARSTLWYRAHFPDGREGFLSDVYVAPDSRGGLGLPDCADAAPRAWTPTRTG